MLITLILFSVQFRGTGIISDGQGQGQIWDFYVLQGLAPLLCASLRTEDIITD